MSIRILAISILTFCFGCIEEFDPEIDETNNLPIVIEGQVTTEDGPYKVRIYQAKATENSTPYTPVSGAIVEIVDNQNNTYPLTEIFPGNYETDPDDFTGIVGRSYQLRVDHEGKIYRSAFEEILPAEDIGDIDARFEYREIQSETGDVIETGFIVVEVDINYTDNSTYYRYEWESTYQAKTNFQGSTVCWSNPSEVPQEILEPDKICYINEESEGFLRLFSSEGLTNNQFFDFEIYTFTPKKRLQLRYSTLIKQYSISKQAYEFWDAIRVQTEGAGGLFDAPPTQIRGNLNNASNPDELVLGYFSASDVKTRREFFMPSLIEMEIDHYGDDCSIVGGLLGPPPLPPVSCCECTFLPNSTDVKPEFWED